MPKNSKAKKDSSLSWEYSSALESVEHISISPVYNLFINGKFVNPISTKSIFRQSPSLVYEYWITPGEDAHKIPVL